MSPLRKRRRKSPSRAARLAIVPLAAAACALPSAPERPTTTRGTVGEEVYGILCDHTAAQALREDLDGSSYRAVCHKSPGGAFADDVDETKLPPIDDRVRDKDGNTIDLEPVKVRRARAIGRVRSLVHRRADVIAALDAAFPDVRVPIKDIENPDARKTCDPLPGDRANDKDKLSEQLSQMLGRIQALYNDGTLPRTTEALGRLMQDLDASPEGRDALARLDARRGYHPSPFGLAGLKPAVAYPRLRDFSNSALGALSADSDPYGPSPQRDAAGHRIPIPGSANPQFVKLLEIAHEELRTMQVEPPLAPLVTIDEPATGGAHVSRPRSAREVLYKLSFSEDDAFRAGFDKPFYALKRDPRGYASVALVNGAIPAPFVPDATDPTLAAIDPLGRFITSDGKPAPSPFLAPDGQIAPAYDAAGRALFTASGAPIYDSIDLHRTLANALVVNLRPLIKPAPKDPEDVLLDLIAGVEVLLGQRDGGLNSAKIYPPDPKRVDRWKASHTALPPPNLGTVNVEVKYDAFHPEASELLDFAHGTSNLLSYPGTDESLSLVRLLATDYKQDFARLIGELLRLKAVSDTLPEARLPGTSTFWDDLLDVLVKVSQEPGMLEDTLNALGDDKTIEIGKVFGNYAKFDDQISYDRANLNGPIFNLTTKQAGVEPKTPVDRGQPNAGDNRSTLQRFLQLVHDTNGVTACNKEGAVLYAVVTSPQTAGILFPEDYVMGNSATGFKTCELLKVDNLAKFYLESIVQKSKIYIRQDRVRNGTPNGFYLNPKNPNPDTQGPGDYCGYDAASTVLPLACTKLGNVLNITSQANEQLFERVTGIKGFWTSNATFAVKPEFLSRFAFFDFEKDATNIVTKTALDRVNGPTIGTRACREKVFPDPCAAGSTAPHAASCQSANAVAGQVAGDKMIHGYYECDDDADTLRRRDDNTLFLGEVFGFQDKTKPLLNVFVNHDKTQLFIDLIDVLHRHYQTPEGAALDKFCSTTTDKSDGKYCARSGLARYEPLLVDILMGDVLPALHDLQKKLATVNVKQCTVYDAAAKRCTTAVDVPAIKVLAETTRNLIDPQRAAAVGVKNRDGSTTAKRNDGTTSPQTTPLNQITSALAAFDDAFAKHDAANPQTPRLPQWRRARSRLVDQLLAVDGVREDAHFKNPVTPQALPITIDILRDQLYAECPGSFAPPFPKCAWAQGGLSADIAKRTRGPLFAATIDLLDAIRKNDPARYEVELLLQYLLDPASPNDARESGLLALGDVVQLLSDETNLVPLAHALVEATGASLRDEQGVVVQQSLIDATTALLARLQGKARDAEGFPICSREIDPNQVLTFALQKLVAPLPSLKPGDPIKTPLEVILDAVVEVNKEDPTRPGEKLTANDYASVSRNVSDFLLDPQRGLEQLYEVIRLGTEGDIEK
ncbi:MAG: hypothetical protein JWM74_5428 [Myxococcaceae bacterium]|nr:hypothetical protein [Myxococcaceae bacterium]